MNPQLAYSPSAYRQSAVLTASPEQLVVMLYDGARRFLGQAAVAMHAGDVQTSHLKLRRAEAIITHLLETLDLDQGDLALRLQSIYLFCNRHLNDARVQLDPKKIEQVGALLGELRSAWSTVANA
jgi:flagellar secretion chaperone FliS